MKDKIQLRIDAGQKARIDMLCERRQIDQTTLVRLALNMGLDCLDQQHFVHFPRLAAVVETTLVMVDMIGEKVGANIGAAPEMAQDRMAQFHVKI